MTVRTRSEQDPPSFWELAEQALSSTQKGYDLLAQRFEATIYCTPSSWVESCLRRVNVKFGASPNEFAADLCCGTGVGARSLGQTGLSVDCWDFSSGMLDETKKRWPYSAQRLRLFNQDFSKIDLPGEHYGRIVCLGAWGHILPEWRDQFCQGVLGALAPEGVFFSIVAEPSTAWSKRAIFSHLFDSAMHLRNRILSEPFHMYYRLNDSLSLERAFSHLGGARFEVCLEPVPGSPHRELSLLMVRRLSSSAT